MHLIRHYIYLFILICSSSKIVTSQENEELTYPQNFVIGLLAPWDAAFEEFSALTSASAVSIAIESIAAEPSLSSKMNFR